MPSILEYDYADRRLILVAPDAVVLASVNLSSGSDPEDQNRQSRWAHALSGLASGVVVGLAPVSMVVPAVKAGLDLVKKSKKAKQRDLGIRFITRSEANSLVFPMGHPLPKVVYVGHPAGSPAYFIFADFHRKMFEHKVAEAINMITSLGAVELRIEHIEGWSTTSRTGASIGLPGLPVEEMGASVSRNQAQGTHVQSEMSLKPEGPPRLPTGLVWYPHEPMWQAVADARLNKGLNKFEMEISYSDDYGIDAKLNTKIANVGFQIGGEFENMTRTVWKMRGSFSG